MSKHNLDEMLENVHSGWMPFFDKERPLLKEILTAIDQDNSLLVFPFAHNVFRAFFFYAPQDIRLVVLGQDPYIGYMSVDGVGMVPQACGLAFSVPRCFVRLPPSLENIFREIQTSCYPGTKVLPSHGSLLRWAKAERILLLNSALTVRAGESNSHQKIWTPFTDRVLRYLSEKNPGTAFLLMGNHAIQKEGLLDIQKHQVYKTVHPSPLSAYRGFFGCCVFQTINRDLLRKGNTPIRWFPLK